MFWGLFNPVIQMTPWGLHNHPPFFWQAHPCVWAVGSGFFVDYGFSSSSIEGRKPPLYRWQGPCLVGGKYSASGRQMYTHLSFWHRGVLTWFTPSLLGLASCDPVWWVAMSILGFTIHQHQWALMSFPPLDVHVPSNVYCHLMLPKVFTHFWWMLWQMSMVKAITSS